MDKFAIEDPANGFVATSSPVDPKPSLRIVDGRVVEMEGVGEADFDLIDEFIARHHIEVSVATEAMATDSLSFARGLVDINVKREELVCLARGMTPASDEDGDAHARELQCGRSSRAVAAVDRQGRSPDERGPSDAAKQSTRVISPGASARPRL